MSGRKDAVPNLMSRQLPVTHLVQLAKGAHGKLRAYGQPSLEAWLKESVAEQ
jgi:hypothetical protein